MQNNLKKRIDEAARVIQEKTEVSPRFGITLGTGLGGLTQEMEIQARIPYSEIPGFPEPRVTSHDGVLVLGNLGGEPTIALEGRYHYYEGYTLEEITFPVRVMKALGVEVAVFSNAAGALNPAFRAGDIMILSDHVNLMGINPLIGPNDEELGPRFPDMCDPYDPELVSLLERIALEDAIRAFRGVYVALTGPCLETRAEYRFLRIIGADAVGMSTVPEVIVAIHAGLKVVGISCITDTCLPDALKPVNIEEILRIAGETEPKMTRLVKRFIKTYRTFV